MAIVEFLDGCDLPPVLFGTGRLFITSGSNELDAGNFSLVDFIGDGETRRVFLGADEVASPLAVTGAYRLELTGDSFSEENLSRLLNEDLDSMMAGARLLNLRTVRAAPTYQIRFEKEYPVSEGCPALRWINLIFWRAYLDTSFNYTFSQDEQTVHRFVFTALPDPINHPFNPLGRIVMDKP
jgi:hypothetical protein